MLLLLCIGEGKGLIHTNHGPIAQPEMVIILDDFELPLDKNQV